MSMRRFVYGTRIVFCLAALGAGTPAWCDDSAVVFMYHRFGESETPSTNIRLDQFERHIGELSTGNYTVLPLEEIVAAFREGRALPDRTVAITIDDAYLSVYTEAWPRLKAAGLPFTLFAATRAIDQGLRGYMNWNQIRDLVKDGVAIGHHSASHLSMTKASRGRNLAELDEASGRFRAELGFVPRIFAYPFGEASAEARRVVMEAGFEAAFGQHSGVAYAGHDRFYLPRFALNERYGTEARFALAANALPLRVSDVTPADPLIAVNPPNFGFTVEPGLDGLHRIACYASNSTSAAQIERLGERRFEIRLGEPFPAGRARINCTMPAAEGRWRWFGTQFFVP